MSIAHLESVSHAQHFPLLTCSARSLGKSRQCVLVFGIAVIWNPQASPTITFLERNWSAVSQLDRACHVSIRITSGPESSKRSSNRALPKRRTSLPFIVYQSKNPVYGLSICSQLCRFQLVHAHVSMASVTGSLTVAASV
jgi:hypothetical protein